MGNGDLSTDLALGIFPSASAGRAAEEYVAHPEAKAKARRRLPAHAEEAALDDADLSSAAGDPPAHQLDRLA